MGTIRVDGEVADVRRPKRVVAVRQMLVDTGSEFSWIPEELLRKAGVRVAKKDLAFVMANGVPISRSTGYAILRVADFETVDEVVFGQAGDLVLLGARTLEGFGATIDPRRKRLISAGPHLAAAVASGHEAEGNLSS